MSATDTAKATTAKSSEKPTEPQQKPAAQLEEDDEFEDFPVEGMDTSSRLPVARLTVQIDWAKEEEVGSQQANNQHLWEESWDDDDTSDDFSVQLKYV